MTSTQQPKWKLVAQLGDVNPIDYGGYFIFEDETGVYPPEGEKLIHIDEYDTWEIRRFTLERCKVVNGYLVLDTYRADYSYPLGHYQEWFADRLKDVASVIGQTEQNLCDMFCSEDTRERARAYEALGDYFGYDNLDSYPLKFYNRMEIEKRVQRGRK